jgi:hypothetical protein
MQIIVGTNQCLENLQETELNVCIGNGANVVTLATDIYHFSLRSGSILESNNCYYILA